MGSSPSEQGPRGFMPIAPSHLQHPQYKDLSRQRMLGVPAWPLGPPALSLLPRVTAGRL